MKGAGEPSANINLVRKVPNATKDFTRLGLSAGSWKFKRADLDASYALNEARSIKARLNVALQDRNYFIDRYKSKKAVLYGVVDFNIGDSSLLRVGADYIDNKNKSVMWTGLFKKDSLGNHVNLPYSANYAPSWATSNSKINTQFANFKHFFANDFELELNYSHQNFKQDWLRFDIDDETYLNGEFSKAYSVLTKADRNINVLSAKLSGYYKVANIPNQFAITLQSNKTNMDFGIYKPKNAIGLWGSFDFNGKFSENNFNQGKPVYELANNPDIKIIQNSISFINNTELTDKLSALLGFRLTKYKRVIDTDNNDLWLETDNYKTTNLSKYFGLTYEYIDGHAGYVSITDIFTPQSELDVNKKRLEPIIGTNYEVGLKSQFFDKNLNANLAIFETRRDKVASFLKESDDGFYWFYEPVNGAKTRGFELGLSGNIDKLNIYGGYTYAVAKNNKKEPLNTHIPTKTFKFALDYELMSKFNIGGDYSWRNTTHLMVGNTKYETPSYGIVNLYASYKISPKFQVQANINNALNKKHISNDWGRYTNGEPRNFMFRAEYQF